MDYKLHEFKDHNSSGFASVICIPKSLVTKVIRDFFLFRVTLKKFSLPWKRSSPKKEIINPDQKQSLFSKLGQICLPKSTNSIRVGQILRYHSFRGSE